MDLPALQTLQQKGNPCGDSLHENGDFWGMAFPRNRFYVHTSCNRKVELVGFVQALIYALNGLVFSFISFGCFGNLALKHPVHPWKHAAGAILSSREGQDVGKVRLQWCGALLAQR